MNHEEQLLKIRQRTVDALKVGMVDESHHGIYQTTLIQILNDCERGRQSQASAIENLKRQIAVAEGQVHAYSMIGNVIYTVLDNLVRSAEKAAKEIAERRTERELVEKAAAEREERLRVIQQTEPPSTLPLAPTAPAPAPASVSTPVPEPEPELYEPEPDEHGVVMDSELEESEPEPEPEPEPAPPPPRRGVVRRPKS